MRIPLLFHQTPVVLWHTREVRRQIILRTGCTGATAQVNGQTIAYATAGSAPLLLLYGFPQSHAMWHGIAPERAKIHTVIAADLRGYGASSKPTGTQNYTFRNMAADQLALMPHPGHHTFHLVGHNRRARGAPSGTGRRKRGAEPHIDRYCAHVFVAKRSPSVMWQKDTITGSFWPSLRPYPKP